MNLTLKVHPPTGDVGIILNGHVLGEFFADVTHHGEQNRERALRLAQSFIDFINPEDARDTWAEDPDFPRKDWVWDVSEGNTYRGYWDWVTSKKEQG